MNGRDGTTAFLPLDFKINGQVGHSGPTPRQFLTREQAKTDKDRRQEKSYTSLR